MKARSVRTAKQHGHGSHDSPHLDWVRERCHGSGRCRHGPRRHDATDPPRGSKLGLRSNPNLVAITTWPLKARAPRLPILHSRTGHRPRPSRLRAIATLGDQSHRTANAIAWTTVNYTKPLRVEDFAEIAGSGVPALHHHFRIADRHESSSVSETASIAGSAGTHAHGGSGRRKCSF